MTLSWHTGHKANGLLLLAVPAAITRVTLSRSSPDEGPLSDVIRQVGLGRIEPGRGPVHLPGQQVVERGRQGVIAPQRLILEPDLEPTAALDDEERAVARPDRPESAHGCQRRSVPNTGPATSPHCGRDMRWAAFQPPIKP